MKYLSLNSPLGYLTIFEDDGYILALEWGKTQNEKSSAILDKAINQLEEYFKGLRETFSLPLKPFGTPFQQTVWTAIKDIPFGETYSYGFIARHLKSAPRAVGGACGRNPIPIFIPCHRVIGKNGKLTGFSSDAGIKDKIFLLNLESDNS